MTSQAVFEFLRDWAPAINMVAAVWWIYFWTATRKAQRKLRALVEENRRIFEENQKIWQANQEAYAENARVVAMWENVEPVVTPEIVDGKFKWVVSWTRQMH